MAGAWAQVVRGSGWRCACSGDLRVEDADVVVLPEKIESGHQEGRDDPARRMGTT